ncbi:MAG: hypothetical protein U0228_00065 [Myxococcaceae bacterium]
MSEIDDAIAAAEAELATIKARHASQLEAEREQQRRTWLALTTEADELRKREVALLDSLEKQNRTVAARSSVRWQTHVAALGLALAFSAVALAAALVLIK